MKKIFCLLLCAIMTILLFSCTEKKDNADETANIITPTELSETMETTQMTETTEEPRRWVAGNISFSDEKYDVESHGEYTLVFKKTSYTVDKQLLVDEINFEAYYIGDIPWEDLQLYYYLYNSDFTIVEPCPSRPRPHLLFLDVINENINIRYDKRVHEDTPERREALAKGLRIYINDEPVGGEITYTQGNNHSDYNFIFDKYYSAEEIDTIRVELGYKE